MIFGRDVVFDETKFAFDGLSSEQWLHSEEEELHDDETKSPDHVEEEQLEDDENYETPERSENLETPRRTKRIHVKPRYLEDYGVLALNAEAYVEDVPENINEIEFRQDKDRWLRAVQEEMDALFQNDTWVLTDLPQGKRPLNNKFKRNKTGNIERYGSVKPELRPQNF